MFCSASKIRRSSRYGWIRPSSILVLLTTAIACGLAMQYFDWKSQHDKPEIPIIAVMGKTGAGKSSFIDALGGRNAVTGEKPHIGHGLGSSNTQPSIHNGALC